MKVSVVLAVEKPDPTLATLLSALKQQEHRAFEVILVSDSPGTISVESLKSVACKPWNLHCARNLGVAHAAGDIVAFLDPLALPDVGWLRDLVAGYESEAVSGVGGPVLNEEPCYAADRLGNRLDAVPPPYWAYQIPYADQYLCLHAGNCSFRRSPFLESGGYDETIGEELAQSDLCMRLTDRGCLLRPMARAIVFPDGAGGCSNEARAKATIDRNHARFAVRSANPLTDRHSVLRYFEAGDDEEDRAIFEGIALAVQDHEQPALLSVASPFSQFPLPERPDRKLTLCFTSPQLRPTAGDPVGRQVWNVARGLAMGGHEIHLFGVTGSSSKTSYTQGVWVHHAADGAELHRAIKTLGASRHLDLVIANGSDASYCLADPSLNCVVCLGTDHAAPHSSFVLHSQVVAPGRALLDRVRKSRGGPFSPAGINICSPVVPDRHADFFSSHAAGTRLLFVGSLGSDHGVDLFLQAVTTLLRERRDLEAIVTGDANEPSETGRSFRTCLESAAVFDPEMRRRIHFVGDLSEDGLCQAIADCQIVCLPYRIDAAAVPCLEAMTFGKAVVASDLDSARELLGDNACGLLHRCGEAASLTDCLRELVADVGLQGRLGRQARVAYENHFDFDRTLAATLSAYQQFIDVAAV